MIVWRRTYESLRAHAVAVEARLGALEARLDATEEERDWLRAQLAAKDAEMLALRREGFDPPPLPPAERAPVEVPGSDLPQDVRRALEMVARPGDHLWLSLAADARSDIANGANPDDVAAAIRRGSTLNPFHA